MLSPTSKSNRNSGTGTEEKSGQMQLNSPSHLSSEDPKRTTTCTKLQQGKMQVVITVSHYSVDNLISTSSNRGFYSSCVRNCHAYHATSYLVTSLCRDLWGLTCFLNNPPLHPKSAQHRHQPKLRLIHQEQLPADPVLVI